jgi:glycine C-acetyltransferase
MALEARLARFLGTDACLLYNSVFEANAGLFAPLLGEQDAIICDQLNNVSIVDGIRLSKAQRHTYRHNDLFDLEACLKRAFGQGAKTMLVFTEGAFFVDGSVARLHTMRQLCDDHGALLGMDDSHGTGVLGVLGRGSHELRGLFKGMRSQMDIITGTLDRALGGMAGGFVCARAGIVATLRQSSRPYLYGNPISPASVAATMAALDVLLASSAPRDKLKRNALYFRRAITEIGYDIKAGIHPIVSILVEDTATVQQLCRRLLELGVRVSGLEYPMAPPEKARVRVQVSAQHELPQLKRAVEAFKQAGMELGLLK